MRTAINTCLTLLIFMMVFLSSIAFANVSCPIGYDMGNRSWDGSIYGERPYMCFKTNRCKAVPDVVSLCFVINSMCESAFLTNGEQCTETESLQSGTLFPGGELITPPDGGDGGSDGGGSDGGDGGSDGGGSDGGDGGGSDNDRGTLPNAPSVGPVIINRNGVTNLTDPVQGVVNSNRTNAQYIERAIYNQGYNLYQIGRESNNLQKASMRNQNSIKNVIDTGLHGLSYNSNAQTQQLIAVRDIMTTSNNQDKAFYDMLSSSFDGQPYQHPTTMRQQSFVQQLNNLTAFTQQGSMYSRGIQLQLGQLQNLLSNQFNSSSNGSGDTSGIQNSIDGIGTDLKGIKDALTTKFDERDFVGKVDFDVDGVLYKSSLYNDLFTEREQLENEYEQLLDKVKNIFSFDTSDLNSGEYNDHILDFLAPDGSGRQFSFKSGVFPAFIQQANLIATILLFIAAVIAVRVIMGGSK